MRKTFNTNVAIVLGGVIFGLIHLVNPHYSLFGALSVVLSGMMLSYIFFKTGNIWMPVAIHAAWNFAIEILNSHYLFNIILPSGHSIHYVSDMEATPAAIIMIFIVWGVIMFFAKKKILLKCKD